MQLTPHGPDMSVASRRLNSSFVNAQVLARYEVTTHVHNGWDQHAAFVRVFQNTE